MLRDRQLCLWGVIALVHYATAQGFAEESVRFNRDIRPLLSDHCYACHGPDANQREADLRLDTEQGLASVTKAGDLDESLLFHHVTSTVEDEQMPPADFGKPLSEEQISKLARWIQSGAQWQGHWSFQPISQESLPSVKPPTPVSLSLIHI